MPLGTREVLLIIRARDQATRLIADVGRAFSSVDAEAQATALSSIRAGSAIAGVGIGLATVGAAGLEFYKSAISAAVDYNQQAALTLTQVHGVSASLEDLKQIGRDVASAIPAPFSQMQASLYDIFSSMDVNVTQAKTLLTGFATAAVAGQTDVQTAGRATISIMNAFKVPVEGVTGVLDAQFATVRAGVVTYTELASTIGRAIPSAVRAGQSYQTLGGTIAFLTRNGLSAAQAATSAARAFDLISNPKFQQHMHAFGIEIFDTAGNFRPLIDIVHDLRDKLANMTPEEATQKLADLTKGAGGTIQAMRFLNLAVNDTGDMLGSLISQVTNSQGQLQSAYDIMFSQPGSAAQLFSNNLDILKTEIGDSFLPVLNLLLRPAIELLQWFNGVNPEIRKWISYISAGAFALAFLNGIVLIAVGGFMILSGLMTLVGGGSLASLLGSVAKANIELFVFAAVVWGLVHAFEALQNNDVVGTIIGITTAVVGLTYAFATLDALAGVTAAVAAALSIPFIAAAALIALVVVAVLGLGYVIYRNWDTIRDKTIEVWGIVEDKLQQAWNKLQDFWGWIETTASNIWGHLLDATQATWDGIVSVVSTSRDAIVSVFGTIVGWVQTVWNKMTQFWGWFSGTFGPGFMDIMHAIGGFFTDVGAQIYETIISIWSRIMWFWSGFMTVFVPIWQYMANAAQAGWNALYEIVSTVVSNLWNLFTAILGPAISMLGDAWFGLWNITQDVWNLMYDLISVVIENIWTVISGVLDIIVAAWRAFSGTLGDIFVNLWNFLTGLVSTAITAIKDIINIFLNLIQGDWEGAWNSIKQFFSDVWFGIWNALQDVWALMVDFFQNIGPNTLRFIGDLGGILYNKGSDLMSGMWHGITAVWSGIISFFQDIWYNIVNAVGDLSGILVGIGKAIIQGLWDGMKAIWDDVTGWLSDLNPANYFNDINYEKGHAYQNMQPAGQALFRGLLDSSKAGWQDYQRWLSTLDPSTAFGDQFGGIGVTGPLGNYIAIQFNEGAIKVEGVTDPVQVAQQVHAQFNELINEQITQGVTR